MYEPVAHSMLDRILDQLRPEIRRQDLRHFYTRLGANFYAMYGLFHTLYGHRPDFAQHLTHLVEVLAARYIDRPAELEASDKAREANHNWFLSQEWVGMALYTDGFAGDLEGFSKRLPYLEELGVNLVHLMPMMVCPEGASDGGYAVSNFCDVDPRVGTLDQLREVAATLRKRGMLLTLDVVLNHTSDEHEWASRARAGDPVYRDYYRTFEDREIPDQYERSMPEVFPETAPGNFTWDEAMGRWVMTVFNTYQWDLDYSNPAVFIEMLDVILFWANQGADVIRLDAVAYIWKRIGTTSQNEREAHLLLQLFKDCCQVTAPGVIFIAEAIVAPSEVIKYFGEDAVVAKECEIAYNSTFMALLWDAVATRNAKLLNAGIQSLPAKLEHATWLNYVRCHDDIGLGFDDADIGTAGYDPGSHRGFLVDYFTGAYDLSEARGKRFGHNDKTGDARIAGSLASLLGLEYALELGEPQATERPVKLVLLLHAMVLSFGGIPLLYYGDEIGTLNDYSYMDDEHKSKDTRWIHRPRIDWDKAARRREPGTVEARIFSGLAHLIAIRKTLPVFADFNNRELLHVHNDHLFAFLRRDPHDASAAVLVVGNFDAHPQPLDLGELTDRGVFDVGPLHDLASGTTLDPDDGRLEVPAYGFYWLARQRG